MKSKNLKVTICRFLMWIMPWLITGPGFMAVIYFAKSHDLWMENGSSSEYLQASNMFDVFYNIAMYGGAVTIFLEWLISILGLIWVVQSFRKSAPIKPSLCRPWDMIFCPGLCIVGTLFLMILINLFSYGMGV